MIYPKPTTPHTEIVAVAYDEVKYETVAKKRWNVYTDEPIVDITNLCHILRKVVNSDNNRIEIIKELIIKHPKVIIFYNFDYELEILKKLGLDLDIALAQYNGHKHEPIPKADSWVYLVQYMSGAEGWNCIVTNTIIFYSQNYSYRMMTQAAGRIDRLNTPFTDLYYYHLQSRSRIDSAISKALRNKKDFNEARYSKTLTS
jgi:superfamily II DNA or RNA helicase